MPGRRPEIAPQIRPAHAADRGRRSPWKSSGLRKVAEPSQLILPRRFRRGPPRFCGGNHPCSPGGTHLAPLLWRGLSLCRPQFSPSGLCAGDDRRPSGPRPISFCLSFSARPHLCVLHACPSCFLCRSHTRSHCGGPFIYPPALTTSGETRRQRLLFPERSNCRHWRLIQFRLEASRFVPLSQSVFAVVQQSSFAVVS